MGIVTNIVGRVAKQDSWVNAMTGLGGLRDKLTAYVFRRNRILEMDFQTLGDMYAEDDMAAKIADKPAQHMMRRGWKYDGLEEDLVAWLEKKVVDLEAKSKVQEVLIWEALYGGAALFIGADDGLRIDQPLNEDNIKSVRFVSVFERRELTPHRWYASPTDEKFGMPCSYHLNYTTVPNALGSQDGPTLPKELAKLQDRQMLEIHESRLVVFPGRLVSKTQRQMMGGWGGSRVVRSMQAIKIFHANWQAVSNIMQDASQGVFKVKGLVNMIAGGQKDLLMARMEMIDMARSVARSLLLDADEEDFERKDTSFAGLPDLLDRTGTRVAASADIPVTVLMGMSPAGLNATGDADIRNWYDMLEAEREERLHPRLRQLIRILLKSKDSPTGGVEPEGWKICFPPLWQMTPEEESTVRSNNATEDATRIQSGVMTPEQVQDARWTKEGYQYNIDAVDFDAQKQADKLYAGLNPPAPPAPTADLTPKPTDATIPSKDAT